MSKSILIVEDNPNMSSLLEEMLQVFDYKSVRADDGQDALPEGELEIADGEQPGSGPDETDGTVLLDADLFHVRTLGSE